jgi:signal recognition particle receptor subunit beta
MAGALLLVFANKKDIPGAMDMFEVTEKLKLNQLKNRTFFTQESCATTGEGLHHGLVSTWPSIVLWRGWS